MFYLFRFHLKSTRILLSSVRSAVPVWLGKSYATIWLACCFRVHTTAWWNLRWYHPLYPAQALYRLGTGPGLG